MLQLGFVSAILPDLEYDYRWSEMLRNDIAIASSASWASRELSALRMDWKSSTTLSISLVPAFYDPLQALRTWESICKSLKIAPASTSDDDLSFTVFRERQFQDFDFWNCSKMPISDRFEIGRFASTRARAWSAVIHESELSEHFGFWQAVLLAANAARSRIGTFCEWSTAKVLKEISFFHVHGTGRPPMESQVQSAGLGSLMLQPN